MTRRRRAGRPERCAGGPDRMLALEGTHGNTCSPTHGAILVKRPRKTTPLSPWEPQSQRDAP